MSDTTGPVWTNAELKRRSDNLALGHSVTGAFLRRVYDAMLVMSMEAQARLNAAEAERDQAQKNEASWRTGYTSACTERDEVREWWITTVAERDALRQELADAQQRIAELDMAAGLALYAADEFANALANTESELEGGQDDGSQ